MRYFAQRILQSPEDAADVMMEIFIKWWTNRLQYSSEEHIKAFLLTSTRNACINFLRSSKRKAMREKQLAYLSVTEQEQPYFDLLEADLFGEIYAEIDRLPPRYQEVFKLSYFEGMSTHAIAERLQVSVKTVQNQKLVATERLRTALLKKNLLPLLVLFFQFLQSKSIC